MTLVAGGALVRLRRLGARLCGAALLAGSATLAAAQPLAEFETVSVPIELRQVTPRVHYVLGQTGMVSSANEGFNSNAGFVVTPEGVVVFDVLGSPALGKRYAELIAGVTPLPVRHVVISHYHADHFYGLQAFTPSKPTIWADERVREYLATEAPIARLAERRQSLYPWVNEKSRLVAPTQTVSGDTVFRLGGLTFRLLRAGPAHTPEDLMMLVEEEGVLFVGDLMFTGRIPFVADADVKSWIAAIDRVLAFKPRIVIGGHGPASTDASADLQLTRDYLVYLREQIGRAFEDGLDFDSAYKRIDWSRYAALPTFAAANRRNAYQTWLNVEREMLGQIKPSR